MSNKPTYVLDATPLIHLAKIGKLELVSRVCDPVIVEAVYEETRQGDHPDALIIEDMVSQSIIRVYKVEDRSMVDAYLRFPGIHRGEAETLAASKLLEGIAIIDDAEARAIAAVYGVSVASGTLFLLFKLLASGIIEAGEADNMLTQLVEHGLYLDPRTLLKAKELINNYRR